MVLFFKSKTVYIFYFYVHDYTLITLEFVIYSSTNNQTTANEQKHPCHANWWVIYSDKKCLASPHINNEEQFIASKGV